MDTSPFEQIASSLTVKSICTRLGPDIRAGSTIEDAAALMGEYGNDFTSRVIDSGGNLVGMLYFGPDDPTEFTEALTPDTVIDELMERVEPNEFLSSTTTILDAIELFGTKRNYHFYVIHISDVVGILHYSDLSKPLVRLTFFALALELETLALRLCQSESERCWRSISANRKSKAIELFTQRHLREPKQEHFSDFDQLLECTNLIDKANMIWKKKLITAATRADVLGFFDKLKKIRDRCAHPGGDWVLSKEALADFVNRAKCMRSSLLDSMRTRGVDWMVEL